MGRALFCEDFGDPEQIQGRSAPVLSSPLTLSMNMDAAGPQPQGQQVRTAGPEYMKPIKPLKECPKPTAPCPEPTALKKLQDFKVSQCLTYVAGLVRPWVELDVKPKAVLCWAEMDQKETWS